MNGAARVFEPPVKWLLGSRLVSGLKKILIYTALGTKAPSKNWMRPTVDTRFVPKSEDASEGAFWFDYIADTGDGMEATYSIASLCLSPLWIDSDDVRLTRPDSEDAFEMLPRGRFLFVGGDTAYHIADYTTLAERFQVPFQWAFDDASKAYQEAPEVRTLVGIPGNHDYYDFLDGFNRQFRRPYYGDNAESGSSGETSRGPQLQLPGFERVQEASYVALCLPFGWVFVGLDAQRGELDRRQEFFFRDFLHNPAECAGLTTEEPRQDSTRKDTEEFVSVEHVPRKERLIVATPEPANAFGRRGARCDPLSRSFDAIGLSRPFLSDEPLDESHCRLDIAGDVHHYARYFGPDEASASNYASVVAGGGGAFFHPTQTDVGEIESSRSTGAQRGDGGGRKNQPYPEKIAARREILTQLLKPWVIALGGYVWGGGAAITVFLTWALVSQPHLHDIVRALAGERAPKLATSPSGVPEVLAETATLGFRLTASIAVLLVFLMALFWSNRFLASFRKRDGGVDPVHQLDGSRCAIRFHGLIVAAIFVGLLGISFWIGSRDPTPHPFAASVQIANAVLFGAGALFWNTMYRETLFRQTRSREGRLTRRDHAPSLVSFLAAIFIPFAAVLKFGIAPLSAVVSDVIAYILLVGLTLGLVALAIVVGARLHSGVGKVGFLFLGAFHSLVQIALPAALVLFLDWTLIVWAVVLSAAASVLTLSLVRRPASSKFFDRHGKWLLLIAWLAPALFILFALDRFGTRQAITVECLHFLLASILGAAFSCFHFGWYLTVCLAFNGHNNEAGGGARLQKYRHFLRIKLTRDAVTVYAIGLDVPARTRDGLKPRLVDRFELKPFATSST